MPVDELDAMTVGELNALSDGAARDAFSDCLASPMWASGMARSRPFATRAALIGAAESAWHDLPPDEWKAAIAHHPRIGESRAGAGAGAVADAVAEANARSSDWSADEQSAARTSDVAMVAAIAAANAGYERRFGHRFIMCATRKSAPEILDAIEKRLTHDTSAELLVTAEELRKIAALRLAKLVPGS
jgi:2-oxo-4-hydroxy-4-carboxy-5-ureidoimidazoline decarboxylase